MDESVLEFGMSAILLQHSFEYIIGGGAWNTKMTAWLLQDNPGDEISIPRKLSEAKLIGQDEMDWLIASLARLLTA